MAEKKSLLNRQNSIWIFILLVVSGIAFFVRWRGIEYVTADMSVCLIPWSESMKIGYGPSILSTFDGDYNMPYVTVLWLLNYLPGRTIIKVKLFSIVFDYLGAIAGGLIVSHVCEKEQQGKVSRHAKIKYFVAAYTAVLFYPSAVLNGGYWGQCDMIYVTFLLYMILALLKDRPALAMVLLGCAFSFKLQAVLILPILLIYYWKTKRISLRHFLLVPIVMELLCIPAIIGGCSVFVPFSVYLRQLGRYPYMYVFYPNLWAIFKDAPYYIFSNVANLSIIAVLGAFAVLLIKNEKTETEKQWLMYALWSVFFTMCFLPCMHERYGLLLEILAILYAFLDRKYGIYAIVIGGGSYVSYVQTTFGKKYFDDKWTAIAYLLCLGFMTYQVIRDTRIGNEVSKTDWKIRVYNWENKAIEFINRYIIEIAFFLLTIFAVVIRKPMIECMSADYLQYLIETDATRSTTLYMAMMWLLSFFSEKSLFFLLKLVCIVSDLLAAAVIALCVCKYKGKLGALVAYAVMLYMPTTYLVSSMWGHVDSLSIALLVSAWLVADKETLRGGAVYSGICIGAAVAFISHYLIPALVLVCVIGKKWNNKEKLHKMILVGIVSMLVLSLAGLLCGYTLGQCILRLFTWNIQSVWVYYPIMLLLLVLCVNDMKWMFPTIVLQMLFLLGYGQFLYEQLLVPPVVIIMGGFIVLLLSGYVYKARNKKL